MRRFLRSLCCSPMIISLLMDQASRVRKSSTTSSTKITGQRVPTHCWWMGHGWVVITLDTVRYKITTPDASKWSRVFRLRRTFMCSSHSTATHSLMLRQLMTTHHCDHLNATNPHPPNNLPSSTDRMMTSSNGNIFRVAGPLCGEFTGPGDFPAQRPVTRSFAVFLDLRLNKRLSKQVIWDAIAPIMTSLWWRSSLHALCNDFLVDHSCSPSKLAARLYLVNKTICHEWSRGSQNQTSLVCVLVLRNTIYRFIYPNLSSTFWNFNFLNWVALTNDAFPVNLTSGRNVL